MKRLRPRGIAFNTVVFGINTMIRLGVGFALLPLLKDGIGSDRLGLFLFATTLTGYFAAFDNSVTASVTRYISEHRTKGQESELAETLRGSLFVLGGFGLIAAVALTILALTAARSLFNEPGLRSIAEPTILITAVTSGLYWPSRAGIAALNGLERYDQSAYVQVITSTLLLVGVGGLGYEHASVPVLVLVYGAIVVLEGVIAAAIAWRPLGVTVAWARGRWYGGELLRGVFAFGAAAFVIGLSDTLINAFDSAIVGAIVSAMAITVYNAAQRPQSGVRQLASLSGLALISPIARLEATGHRRRAQELVIVASLVSIAVAAPIAMLMVVLARPFFVAWLGAGYGHYAFYLQLFTIIWVISACTSGLSSALYGIGRLRTYSRQMIAMGVVSLPLSVGLTVAWGAIGVIWGTAIPAVIFVPFFLHSSLGELEIGWGWFTRSVLLPGYGITLLWSAALVGAKLLVSPHGYLGLAAFSAPALILCWGLFAPLLRDRVREARALAAAGA